MVPKKEAPEEPDKEKRPFKKQVKTWLKGTLLKYFLLHLNKQELTEAEYVRGLIRKDIKERYNL